MSTKTTIKRIALVAVSALGLGMVTTVAAFAGNDSATTVTIGAAAPSRATVQTAISFTISGTYTASTSTQQVGAVLASYPSTSTAAAMTFERRSVAANTPSAYTFTANTGSRASISSGPTASTTDTGTASATFTAGSSTSSITGNLLFTPDVAGTYTILLFANGSSYSAGLPTATVTITTAGAPATATLTAYGSTFAKSAAATSGTGALLKVSLLDANGVATVPTAYESIDLTAQGASDITTVGIGGTAQTSTSKKSYSASSFKYGSLYLNVDNTAAETFTIALAGSGTLVSGINASVSLTSKTVDSTATGAAAVVVPDALVATAANTGGFTAATGSSTSTNLTVQPLQWTVTALTATTAAAYYGYEITDTSGKITGALGAVYSPAFLSGNVKGDTAIEFSVAASLGTSTSSSYNVTPWVGTTLSSGTALTVTGGVGSVLTSGSSTNKISASVIRSAVGGTVSVTVKELDQFGSAIPNAAITASISGRNALTSANTNLITDASGYATFTYTDAGTASTVLVQDTVSLSDGSNTAASFTILFAPVTVKTVTVTGGNTTASVTSATVTVNPISAGDGAEGGAKAITATVKDANGNLLAGVPVTFSVAGSGAAIPSNAQTVNTTTLGTAASSIYAWLAGTYTYTVTAGGVSTTGTITFGSTTPTNARIVSASVSGNVVTGKVVDRFGNPVNGVTLYASTSSSANIGGAFVTSGTSASDGTVSWVVTGSGTVTVSAVNPTAVAGTTYGQTCALAGNLTCAVPGTAATAFTASTTGTALKAETYVGASYAPAGVASASVDVTNVATSDAIDAANEATDAANAATDAANAAAEAADAATAAAQDAQAAVAALASQVADLIAGIKAQITALTNLVIKIQKKVKA